MSYLGLPRVHFMGLFYSAPGNLNNDINNFTNADQGKPLNYNTGLYKYPDGTSQLWLSNCRVTSVVGTDGTVTSDPARDALVGSLVTSPGPDTQKPDGSGGLYAFAKLVDLDPNMQFRSEVYGFRIYVDLPGGGGFSGLFALPPQLRDLWFGRNKAGIDGLQIAVGTWHQRLTNLTWTQPAAKSAVFDALQAGAGPGLDIKMAVDMFQTKRDNEFTQGDRFGYGRLAGAIGLAAATDPKELVPGRRLYTPRTFATPNSVPEEGKTKAEYTREAAENAMAKAASTDWNRTDFRVHDASGRSFLIADLFNSAPLADGGKGAFGNSTNVTVCFADGTPLTNGSIAFSYTNLDSATRKLKDIVWPQDAGIFQIELTSAERSRIANTPIMIQAGGTLVVRENTNGFYINTERASVRLQPTESQMVDMYCYTFGQPDTFLPFGLRLTPMLYNDSQGTSSPTNLFTVSVGQTPTGPGRFQFFLNAGPAADTLPAIRQPLDSLLCLVQATGAGYLVGEAMTLAPQTGPPTPPFLSLLFWQNHKVVPQPTWDKDIYPLMKIYAALFPGMKSILDISDLPTVKGFVQPLIDRFSRIRTDPGFMPVSRDMSPKTVDMILQFLNTLAKEQQS